MARVVLVAAVVMDINMRGQVRAMDYNDRLIEHMSMQAADETKITRLSDARES